jgi:hypothetical protein
MRVSVCSFVLASLVALAGACSNDSANPGASDAGVAADMAASAQPDLSPTLGCNGYLTCLRNAIGLADRNACDANATKSAMDLLNAVFSCANDTCMAIINDGGTPPCRTSTTYRWAASIA